MFTTKVPKPKISETFTAIGKPLVSETYTKVPKPSISGTWSKVKLETAPASNLTDIGEADYTVVDDSNTIPNVLE